VRTWECFNESLRTHDDGIGTTNKTFCLLGTIEPLCQSTLAFHGWGEREEIIVEVVDHSTREAFERPNDKAWTHGICTSLDNHAIKARKNSTEFEVPLEVSHGMTGEIPKLSESSRLSHGSIICKEHVDLESLLFKRSNVLQGPCTSRSAPRTELGNEAYARVLRVRHGRSQRTSSCCAPQVSNR